MFRIFIFNNASYITKSHNGKYLYSIADEGVEVLRIEKERKAQSIQFKRDIDEALGIDGDATDGLADDDDDDPDELAALSVHGGIKQESTIIEKNTGDSRSLIDKDKERARKR